MVDAACRDGLLESPGPHSTCLAEQLDEVQLLEAMAGREGEFEWRQARDGGISGRLQVFLNLSGQELLVSVAKRESRAGGVATATKPTLPLKHSRVSHLPPVSLHFELPSDYPLTSKPLFTLSCSWLNFSLLTTLCQRLDSLWEEGCVVLYTWQQFLSSDILQTLKISSELVLRFEDPVTLDSKRDKRAVQDMMRPSLLLPFLLDYDEKEREREFAESYFDCEICFTCLPGSKCRRLEPCRHTHCSECLSQHVTTKIGSGEVTQIECPSGSCDTSLPLNLIQELVSGEVFERFDRLLLQKTIDKMSDVVYCPRPSCRCVTLREEDEEENMAMCPRCRFSFCVLCKHSWHGVDPCKLLPTDIQDLRETWQSMGPVERREYQLQYGKDKLDKAFQEYDSIRWLDSNSRKCPNCQAKIQKALGCNKMTCTCSSSFCWLCSDFLPRVNPYGHFQEGVSKCAGKLFQGLTDSDEEEGLWLF